MFNYLHASTQCAKVLLISMNVICILLALFTFGFAVVDTRILKTYGEGQAAGTLVGDLVVIVASLLLVCVAILGCAGTIKNSIKILYLYVSLLLILVLLEIMIAIYVSLQRYGLQFMLSESLREDFFRNYTGEVKITRDKVWDDLQITYECCGLNGADDYAAIGQPISLSCCQRAYRARTANAQQQMYNSCLQTASYFRDGCEDAILDILRADADYLLGVAVLSFWFESVCMLLALLVANQLKNAVSVYKHTVKY